MDCCCGQDVNQTVNNLPGNHSVFSEHANGFPKKWSCINGFHKNSREISCNTSVPDYKDDFEFAPPMKRGRQCNGNSQINVPKGPIMERVEDNDDRDSLISIVSDFSVSIVEAI